MQSTTAFILSPPLNREINFDGLVGPTHNYGGLSHGNIASIVNRGSVSCPREAAMQGLNKMKLLHDLGIAQGVLPPQERPHLPTLRALGFASVCDATEDILLACSSSSSMWAANAATVSPAADTADGKVHITPANLAGSLHRSIETAATARTLKRIFSDERYFVHHDPLPAAITDEGAANHMRFSNGIEIFVYGEKTMSHFPARQMRQASEAIARLHLLDPEKTFFLRQSPKAIDAGVFHSDVIAMSNENLLIYHEDAFADPVPADVNTIVVSRDELTLDEAVQSFFFNSQLVTQLDGSMTLIAPVECREMKRARKCVERLPVGRVEYVDTGGSMRNGGGPACLRLRVICDPATITGRLMSEELYDDLAGWIARNYREKLHWNDLADPQLLKESQRALEELAEIF